jgi:hypothetical protein
VEFIGVWAAAREEQRDPGKERSRFGGWSRSPSAWSGRIVIAKPVDTTRRRHSAAGLLRCEPGLLTLIGYTHRPSRAGAGLVQ